MVFQDRIDAGRQLARALSRYKRKGVVVYALPRGGIVAGAEVANYLHAPLDVLIANKIGHPMSPEYTIGAVTEKGRPVWDVTELGYADEFWCHQAVKSARQEAKRRRVRYQGDQPTLSPRGKVVIVVDDGITTGLTMVAAIRDLRKHRPKTVIAAVPVAPELASVTISKYVDEMHILHIPPLGFGSVGAYYRQFDPVSDEEVRQALDAYRGAPPVEPLDLEALNAVLATIRRYPTTNKFIANAAKRLHAPPNVVKFFESIPGQVEFNRKADIMNLSEDVQVIMAEEPRQPDEVLRSYDG